MKNFHLDRGSTATMAFFSRNVQKKNNTSFTFGKWLNANFEDKMKDKVKNLQLIIILRSFFPLYSRNVLRVLGLLYFKGKTILKSLFSREMI